MPGLQKILPDPHDRKRMSSLGTWATLSRDHALIYGNFVYEVDIPDGKYLEAPTDNFYEFWFDEGLLKKYLSPRAKLTLYSPTGKPALDYFTGKGGYPNFEGMKPKDRYPAEEAFREIEKIIFTNWDYLKDWRDKRTSQGYDGVVWKNSGIDVGRDHPHTVYLVWGDMKVLRQLTPEETRALSNPREPKPRSPEPTPLAPTPPPKPEARETVYAIRNGMSRKEWLVIEPENGTGDPAVMLKLYRELNRLPNAKGKLTLRNGKISLWGGSGMTAATVARKAHSWLNLNGFKVEDDFRL